MGGEKSHHARKLITINYLTSQEGSSGKLHISRDLQWKKLFWDKENDEKTDFYKIIKKSI